MLLLVLQVLFYRFAHFTRLSKIESALLRVVRVRWVRVILKQELNHLEVAVERSYHEGREAFRVASVHVRMIHRNKLLCTQELVIPHRNAKKRVALVVARLHISSTALKDLLYLFY